MLVDEEECEKSQVTFYRHYFGIIPWQSPFSRTKWLLNSTNRTNIQRYQPNELKVHNKISFVILLLRDLEIPAQIVTNDTAVHTVVIRNGLSLSADDAPNEWIYGDNMQKWAIRNLNYPNEQFLWMKILVRDVNRRPTERHMGLRYHHQAHHGLYGINTYANLKSWLASFMQITWLFEAQHAYGYRLA